MKFHVTIPSHLGSRGEASEGHGRAENSHTVCSLCPLLLELVWQVEAL